MLLSLNVKNFAIIDNIGVDLENGMTALTGETGAGKSLIIDAISLLFGGRSSNELVRFGETKATIEGVFTDYSIEVQNILQRLDIDNDEILVIKREIYNDKKSIAKVNGETVTLSVLNELALYLGDIHTQFDTYKLVNPQNYFDFLDDEETNKLINEYKACLKEYNKYLKEYNDKIKNQGQMNQRLDFLKYQKQELEKAKLTLSEEEELNEKYLILSNHEKIYQNYFDFLSCYDDNNILEHMYSSIALLKKNIEYDKTINEKLQHLEEAYYNIEDIIEDIKMLTHKDEFDISDLDYVNERLNTYSTLKRKYKKTTIELIEYLEQITKEINEFDNFDFYLEELTKHKNLSYQKTLEIGKSIHERRINKASELAKELKHHLFDLELKNTNISIKIDLTSEFKNNGLDNIDFLISFNKGEPLKSLSKVASGGELSRFMLGLKAVTCANVTHKTYIFDEIDTGVSGEIAQRIGEKMKQISYNNQVICVTHLPQVAAICDHHLFISKKVIENNRTITNIDNLSYDKRIEAIALMLSKGKITEATKALAVELISVK